MAGFLETQRRDLWWAQPVAVFTILTAFVAYATWAAFQNAHFHFGNYLSPALVILPFPALIRFTCYDDRGPYDEAMWADPPSCTVGEPHPPDGPDGTWRMQHDDIEHHEHARFVGPRLLVYASALEMHPLDVVDRTEDLKRLHGIGYCNVTKCCTNVCPENIAITDNAIIPLKERVVDRFYDPLGRLFRALQW